MAFQQSDHLHRTAAGSSGAANYLHGIDAIRFAAAVMVAAFHMTWHDPRMAEPFWFGWIGVQIFFVVSGFVIANSANGASPMAFARSRFLRLYPAAWICAVLSFVTLAVTADVDEYLIRRFIASFVLYPVGDWLATAYWTLPIEMVFYFLVFVMLLVRHANWFVLLATVLSYGSAAYLILYAASVFGIVHLPHLEFEYGKKNLTLLRHGVFFAIGIFFWLGTQGKLRRSSIVALAVAVLAACLGITCRSREIVAASPAGLDLASVWWVPILIWASACALIIASSVWKASIAALSPIWLRVLRNAGLITYPLYLLHEAQGFAVRDQLFRIGAPAALGAVAGVLASIALASAVALVAEPALRRYLLSAAWSRRLGDGCKRHLGWLYRQGAAI